MSRQQTNSLTTNTRKSVLEYDLWDHWVDARDHRCQNYWRHQITLEEAVHVTPSKQGAAMWGTYPPGVWRFCNTHHRIFQRDRDDRTT